MRIRLFTLLLLTIAGIGSTQTFTANLTGLVADGTGGAIPGATVTLENNATRETRETLTSTEGRFNFSQLLPGTYELRAEATGFKASVQKNINLIAGQSAALNFSLQVGDLSQRVEVGATIVQVDTQTANESVTLTRDMVQNLPTNLRNPFTLVHATAGVTAPATGILQSVADQNHDRFGLNGGRSL